jgi:hypothetical protein
MGCSGIPVLGFGFGQTPFSFPTPPPPPFKQALFFNWQRGKNENLFSF